MVRTQNKIVSKGQKLPSQIDLMEGNWVLAYSKFCSKIDAAGPNTKRGGTPRQRQPYLPLGIQNAISITAFESSQRGPGAVINDNAADRGSNSNQ
jgi:hypothetical protein